MLRTFRIGGIHPPENKLSAGKKITALAAPKQVIIPLSQHIGAPAQWLKPAVLFLQISIRLFLEK